MPASSNRIDVRGLLARSFLLEIDEDRGNISSVRMVGDGASTSYYDIHGLDLGSTPVPEFWRDHIRYELSKHTAVVESLVFEDSVDCGPDRYNALMDKLQRVVETESIAAGTEFFAIGFRLAPNHEVVIFILRSREADQSVGDRDS